ncbi:MAG TPA: hypothetical protein VMS92_06920 [Mycobacterium sp.]|nr:hypothetical protein [Mycobacterium sp.]
MTVHALLLFAALILFVLAAIGIPAGRVNLTAAGLACLAGALLLPAL